MKRFVAILVVLGTMTLGLSIESFAAADGSRGMKKLGFYGALLSDPYPNLWGINIGYNFAPFVRGVVGYGGFSYSDPSGLITSVSGSALGFGATAFVPGWNLSPYAGIHFSSFNAEGTFQFSGNSLTLPVGGTTVVYTNVGLEWQTNYGLLFGVGVSIPLSSAFADAGITVPCARLGWFF